MPSREEKYATRISLKRGKDKPIRQRHQWIYSGAIQQISGSDKIAEVFDQSGEKLGLAFLNRTGQSIAAHMIAYGEETLEAALRRKLEEAAALRKTWFDPKSTNAWRLINAEGDGLPGLIVDAYDRTLVIQISHPGMDFLKETIVQNLIEILQPVSIYEKSTSFLRKKTGLEETRSLLYGQEQSQAEILENGLRFSVDFLEGQKTGLFLDQREMRALVRELAPGKRILNAFAYTGGFSIAALANGAAHVDSVEISARCKPFVEKNLALNQIDPAKHNFLQQDVFEFLKSDAVWDYDLVILDPPAFVKKREDVSKAFRAYKDMNARAMQKMKSDALLLTCSCSYHVDAPLFQNILFRSSLESGRNVQILGHHRQAIDHPISIFHPESSYLKSLLLAVK